MSARRLFVFTALVIVAIGASYIVRSCSSVPSSPDTADPVSPLVLSVPDDFHYLQTDKRWSDAVMGASGGTISDFGCTLSSVAMAVSNLGVDVDPGVLNAALNSADGYTDRGWLKWGALEDVTEGAVKVTIYDEPKAEQIDLCLQDGHYPVVKFMLDDRVQHWALVVGKTTDDWVVRDPLDDTRTVRPLGELTSAFESVRCIRPNSEM